METLFRALAVNEQRLQAQHFQKWELVNREALVELYSQISPEVSYQEFAEILHKPWFNEQRYQPYDFELERICSELNN